MVAAKTIDQIAQKKQYRDYGKKYWPWNSGKAKSVRGQFYVSKFKDIVSLIVKNKAEVTLFENVLFINWGAGSARIEVNEPVKDFLIPELEMLEVLK